MFTVSVDSAKRRVVSNLSGSFSVADVADYVAALERAITGAGWASGEYDLLQLTEGDLIQSPETVEAFVGAIAHSRFKSRRLATVRHTELSRMQARRIAQARDNAAIFCSVEEAESWLDDVPFAVN